MSYHIRDVLKSVQEAAPAPRTTTDDIIAKAGRIRARRTMAAVAGGVAAVVVTATAVVGLAAPSPDGQIVAASPAASGGVAPSGSAPAPVSSAPPIQPAGFSTDLGEYRVGGYKVGPAGQVAPGYQEIPVYRDGETWQADDGTLYPLVTGTITVYRPGVYDTALFGGAGNETLVIGAQYRVSVGGKPGVGRDMTFISPGNRDQTWVRAALAWQYAPNAWATFVPNFDRAALPRADVAKIAAGLTKGPSRDLRVPYRLGYLPEGWQPVAVTQTSGQLSTEVSTVFLHDGPLTEGAATRIDEVFPHSAKITVSKGQPKDTAIRGKQGLHCYTGRATCTIVRGAYLIQVEDLAGVLSDAEVRQIAEGLQFVDLADQDDWVALKG